MIPVRQDSDAQGLRLLAGLEKAGKVVRRLLGIAHILDGRSRQEAAELVGLAPRDLTRAVKRYNAEGVAGLRDRKIPGRPSRLTPKQDAELKRRVLAGPRDRPGRVPGLRHCCSDRAYLGHPHERRSGTHQAAFAEPGDQIGPARKVGSNETGGRHRPFVVQHDKGVFRSP